MIELNRPNIRYGNDGELLIHNSKWTVGSELAGMTITIQDLNPEQELCFAMLSSRDLTRIAWWFFKRAFWV